MKLKLIFITVMLFAATFVAAQKGEFKQKKEKPGIGKPHIGKHRPNGLVADYNNFKISSESINLLIPVANTSLYVDSTRIFNLPNKKVSAILVVLNGDNRSDADDNEIKGSINCTIPFDIVKGGLEKRKLEEDHKLIVLVVYDNELGDGSCYSNCLLQRIKRRFKQVKNYKDWRIQFGGKKSIYNQISSYGKKCDQKCPLLGIEDFIRPPESDGDVIGGNE